jgi:hypothetical protein
LRCAGRDNFRPVAVRSPNQIAAPATSNTPAEMPERDFSTLPSSVDVSGGTSNPRSFIVLMSLLKSPI